MNTRPAIDTSTGPVALSASFNHERNRFAVGHERGFIIFNSDPCAINVSRDFDAGIGIVEMLGKSNLVALVGGGKQPKFPENKVIVWDDSLKRPALSLECRTPILRVRLSRSRIVICLQNTVKIHDFAAKPKPLAEFETADNHHGLCLLSSNTIAFAGRTPGQVQTVEVDTGNVSIIPAHSSPLRALELSSDGQLLATASEAGTLIRVFSAATGTRVAELRRGVDHATIFSLGISPDKSMIAVTSDKATLHIFDLPLLSSNRASLSNRPSHGSAVGEGEEESPSHKWGFLGKIPFLPRVFADEYSFASAQFETSDDPTPGVNLVGKPYVPIPGIPGGRPIKGIIGWLDEQTIVVLGTGRDGRWEKFVVGPSGDGRRLCERKGWKRYLGN